MKIKKFQCVIFKDRKHYKAGKNCLTSGFLLTEIMIALMTFAIFGIFFARYQVQISKIRREANDYLQAVVLVRTALSESSAREEERKEGRYSIVIREKDFDASGIETRSSLKFYRFAELRQRIVSVAWKNCEGQGKELTASLIYAKDQLSGEGR